MTGINLSDVIQFLIILVGGGGLGGLLKLLYDRRKDKTEAGRADRAEPLELGKGVVELTDLLQKAAADSVRNAQAELVTARHQLEERGRQLAVAQSTVEQQGRDLDEHLSRIERLTRRIKQLVGAMTRAGVPVPDEEP